MATYSVVQTLKNGKIVALEGNSDLIATQLRLLPPSPNILTLQAFQDCINKGNRCAKIEPRIFVRDVYTVLEERLDAARTFLDDKGDGNAKIVFMNGGSVRARSICIEEICQNVTNGQIGVAEALFNEIVSNHVAGLVQDENSQQENYSKTNEINNHEANRLSQGKWLFNLNSEQKYGHLEQALECKSSPYSGTGSLPVRQLLQNSSELIDSDRRRAASVDSPLVTATNFKPSLPKAISPLKSQQDLPFRNPHISSSSVTEINARSTSPTGGQTRVLVRPKSATLQPSSPASRCLVFSKSEQNLGKKFHLPSGAQTSISQNAHSSLPTFLKAYQNTIVGSPTSNPDTNTCNQSKYVDKGSDAELLPRNRQNFKPHPYQSVFELPEDFIIHITGGITELVFESVLRSYQDGKVPSLFASSTNISSPNSFGSAFNSQSPEREKENEYNMKNYSIPVMTRSSIPHGKYDPPTPSHTPPPNSSHNSATGCKILTLCPMTPSSVVSVQNSLRKLLSRHLPAGRQAFKQNRFSTSSEAERLWKPVFGNSQFCEDGSEATTVDQIIALGSEDRVSEGFTQRILGLLAKLGAKKSGVTRSSILDIRYLATNALESSSSARARLDSYDPFTDPSEFATMLVPQLETYMATNPSTRLLILHYPPSYLPIVLALRGLLGGALFQVSGIINALASDSPPSPTVLPPFAPNPLSNDAVALRNRSRPQSSRVNAPSGQLVSSTPCSPLSIGQLSIPAAAFSRADYVLPSTATSMEINSYIIDIRKLLIEKSEYYVAEPEPEPLSIIQTIEKDILTPSPSISTATPRPSTREKPLSQDGYSHSKNRRYSKVSRLTGSTNLTNPLSEFKAKHSYTPSVASSRRTFASSISADVDGWENFDIDEADSDFDEYDRMIMGSRMIALVVGRHMLGSSYNPYTAPERRAASKRKALKWLGLA
ncbi:BgTH12-01151 [Blumeria graminis f. sp. triticale]|uniref:BgTH12-01151 n=1 Tax=Blumeria graminis f. sp. triticale TaxID=1689686 RepID=A0A9W4DS98_BLUGR|nr:BgTH12-01151 [Blumeria graminis f. sp. triticale]